MNKLVDFLSKDPQGPMILIKEWRFAGMPHRLYKHSPRWPETKIIGNTNKLQWLWWTLEYDK